MGMDIAAALNTNNLKITPAILSMIAEIDEFKGAWQAIGRIAPERLAALQRIATIESVGSSTRIEGAKLSDQEVEKLLSNLKSESFSTRDEQEVAGYADVMETIFSHHDVIPLTENHILQLHRDLLAHSTKDKRHRGAYKSLPNHVEAFNEQGKSMGVIFATATPFDTPRFMAELIKWFRSQEEKAGLHPLLIIAIFVVTFLAIHPFQDGNGRLSRILTTLFLLRSGYSYVPYASLETIIEQNKDNYYLSLRRTQGTFSSKKVNWDPWTEFFIRALQQQKKRLEKKMERERLVIQTLPELSVLILELVRERGRITVAEVAQVSGASRSTIKDHLRSLAGQRQLTLHGAGRGAWYSFV